MTVPAQSLFTSPEELRCHQLGPVCTTRPSMPGSAPEGCSGKSSTCQQPNPSKAWNMVVRKTLVIGAAATAGAAAAALAAPAVLPAVGFGSVGVSAGSIAAGIQSTMGGVIVKGSLFSLCQSWGAVGLPATVQAVSAATGAGLCGAAAAVDAAGAVCSMAAKAGECLAIAGTSVATLPSAVWPVAVKTGTWAGNAGYSAASAVKAGALAAGSCLGIECIGAGAKLEKPPASRL